MWVLIEIARDVTVPAHTSTLERRLAPQSPLMVALEGAKMEEGPQRYVISNALYGLSPCLVEGDIAQQALVVLLGHLGWNDSDERVLDSLERKLTVPSTLHMFAVADWLLVGDFSRRLSTWLLRLWMQSAHIMLAGIADVDAGVLQAARRAGLFQSASISEQALSKACTAAGLGTLAALACDGEVPHKRQRTEIKDGETFPIFVRGSWRNLVISGCSAQTDVLTLKCFVADRTGIPEECIRLVFQGKPLADPQRLNQLGVRRDSTLHLALAAHSNLNTSVRQVFESFQPARCAEGACGNFESGRGDGICNACRGTRRRKVR